MNVNVVLQLSARPEETDPVAYGRWLRAMLRELVDEPSESRPRATPRHVRTAVDPSRHDAPAGDINGLAARWYAFAPQQRGRLGQIIDGLQQRGYRLEPSVDRNTGEPGARSYARVLRADGANLGYLKTTAMDFVGPRDRPPVNDEPTILRVNSSGAPLRYPRLDITNNDAVPVLLRVADAFAREAG